MFGEAGRGLALPPAPAVDHQDLVIALGADGKITNDWREGFGLAANGFVLKIELHLCTGLHRCAGGRRALGWRCPASVRLGVAVIAPVRRVPRTTTLFI